MTPQSIQMNDVESSNINAIGYDAATGTLAIRFWKGRGDPRTIGETYHYPAVPQDIYDALIDADSVGKYFHRHIRNDFPGEKQ